MTEAKPVHSPLGASSAERWMNCPGSNVLLKALDLPPTDETDYQRDGTAAHECASKCAVANIDTWEVMGEEFNGVKCDEDMATAVQTFINTIRPEREDQKGMWWSEFKIAHDLHPKFYGTLDWGYVSDHHMAITDYKHGEGIVVEPYKNPQLMYYAFGLLQHHEDVRSVKLRIVQPRAFHVDGPVREWETTAEEIADWAHTKLFPAMEAAEIDETLAPGPWCRFCPAKLYCPLLTGLFGAAANSNPQAIPNMNDDALARDYALRDAVKFYMKALEDETFKRLQHGHAISSAKLVAKRADRVFKTDTPWEKFDAAFGDDVWTKSERKTPAQMEKINGDAKELVKQWAYMPNTGLTVAPADDRRQEIKVQSTTEAFGAAIANLKTEE